MVIWKISYLSFGRSIPTRGVILTINKPRSKITLPKYMSITQCNIIPSSFYSVDTRNEIWNDAGIFATLQFIFLIGC